MKSNTIQQFFKQFSNDKACLEHLFKVRFGQDFTCPRCSSNSKWYRIKAERAYSCGNCGNHLHPTVGTPFEGSRTSLQLWFYAIYLFTQTRSGVSAKELQRQLGVTYKCAWRMGHEIRKHMAYVDGDPQLDGTVEIDETYIGGVKEGKEFRGGHGKAILFGMLDRDGDVMTKVIDNTTRATVYPHILENIEKGSKVYTDEHSAYSRLNWLGYDHEHCTHVTKQYAIGDCHVNTIEGFWSRLKQSIGGTHVFVSPKHLEKYAGEFEYRFNSRNHPEKMQGELLGVFAPYVPESLKKEQNRIELLKRLKVDSLADVL